MGLLTTTLWAGTITFDPGVMHVISPGMEDFATRGADMNGIVVTATFENGETISRTWVADPNFGFYGGVAEASGQFRVWQDGDTWGFLGGPWAIENKWPGEWLQKVVIDGTPGGIVFDLTSPNPNDFGTPGSAKGTTLTPVAGSTDYDVVYRNLARIQGSAPVGDLYTQIELTFAGRGLTPGGFVQFNVDTDEIPRGASLVEDTGAATPEPLTAASVLVGLGLVVLAKRRRLL